MNVVHCTKKFIGGRRTKDEGRKRRKKKVKKILYINEGIVVKKETISPQ